MNREIKFRGRRKDNTIHNGSWAYGHYFTSPLTDENSGLPAESGWFFLSGSERRHCIEQDGVAFTVDPETIGQYTGLKDKNGVEICEGDIVLLYGEFDEGVIGYEKSQVTFNDGCFCITDAFEYGKDPISIRTWVEDGGEFVEVIGNIYEHPDLVNNI